MFQSPPTRTDPGAFKFMEYEKRLEVMALAAAAAPCAPERSNMPAALMPRRYPAINHCPFNGRWLENWKIQKKIEVYKCFIAQKIIKCCSIVMFDGG